MDEAIKILQHSETVLMKKIKGMKDGKPKYAANEKIRELRSAISILKQANLDIELNEEEETAFLTDMFTINPPKAQA